jgi:hypothetical protein
MKICLVNAPENYQQLLATDITAQLIVANKVPDLVHLFATNKTVFEKSMYPILQWAKKNTEIIIWVSWYKKSSGMATDLNEDLIRHFALQHDLVDVKVCAVSECWSGLKLVVPVRKRK